MIYPIVIYGSQILRNESEDITPDYPELKKLIEDMWTTLAEAEGVGLAAPQVGLLRRYCIVDVGDGLIELINPEIIYRSEETDTKLEGCLSLPGQWGIVTRPMYVKVRALNRYGKVVEYEGEDLLARCFCHELDHLDGKLYCDVADRMLTKDEIEELRG